MTNERHGKGNIFPRKEQSFNFPNNRNCCSENQGISQFSIGSRVGTAILFTLASTQLNSVQQCRFSPSRWLYSFPRQAVLQLPNNPAQPCRFPLPLRLHFFSSVGRCATTSSNITSSSLASLDLDPSAYFKTNGITMAISVSTSIGAVVLIIACFLIY